MELVEGNRRRRASGTADSRAIKALKTDTEAPEIGGTIARRHLTRIPAQLASLELRAGVHPELRRLRQVRARRTTAVGRELQSRRLSHALGEAGLSEAALREPGPWYCTNPFSRICSKDARDAVESYGSFGSAEACLSSCEPPRGSGIFELIQHYAQPEPGLEKEYGPPVPAYVWPNLRNAYEQLERDSRRAKILYDQALNFTDQPELMKLIGDGRGYLALADMLLDWPQYEDRLVDAIQGMSNKTWAMWLENGAFSDLAAQRRLGQNIGNEFAAQLRLNYAASEDRLAERIMPLAKLVTYVPQRDRQQLLTRAFNYALSVAYRYVDETRIPVIRLHMRVYGFIPVLDSLARVFPKITVHTYNELREAQAYAAVLRAELARCAEARDCGMHVPENYFIESNRVAAEKALREVKEEPVAIPIVSIFDGFRSPLPPERDVAAMREDQVQDLTPSAAFRILLSSLQDDADLHSADPCVRAQAIAHGIAGRAMARAMRDERYVYSALRDAQKELYALGELKCNIDPSWIDPSIPVQFPQQGEIEVNVPVAAKEDGYVTPLPDAFRAESSVVVDFRKALSTMLRTYRTLLRSLSS